MQTRKTRYLEMFPSRLEKSLATNRAIICRKELHVRISPAFPFPVQLTHSNFALKIFQLSTSYFSFLSEPQKSSSFPTSTSSFDNQRPPEVIRQTRLGTRELSGLLSPVIFTSIIRHHSLPEILLDTQSLGYHYSGDRAIGNPNSLQFNPDKSSLNPTKKTALRRRTLLRKAPTHTKKTPLLANYFILVCNLKL